MYAHQHTNTHTHTHTSICIVDWLAYTAKTRTHAQTHALAYAHACTHIHQHGHTHDKGCVKRVCVCKFVRVCVWRFAHTHTHAPKFTQSDNCILIRSIPYHGHARNLINT